MSCKSRHNESEHGARGITSRFQKAGNTHDIEAFGRLFQPDATFVYRFVTQWHAVDQIIVGHADIHASIYRDLTLAIDVRDVDPISDDAAAPSSSKTGKLRL